MRALYSVKRPAMLDRLLGDDYDQTVVAELGIDIYIYDPASPTVLTIPIPQTPI